MIQTIHELTANITQTPTQHGSKAQHSTVIALHTLKQIITVALDISKASDTVNTHPLIRKLLQTSTPVTVIKFAANNIKGRKAYTTKKKHKSIQRQVKAGVPKGGVLSPTLFNTYTANFPADIAPVQVMLYADHITITFTHTSMSAAKNTYNHT